MQRLARDRSVPLPRSLRSPWLPHHCPVHTSLWHWGDRPNIPQVVTDRNVAPCPCSPSPNHEKGAIHKYGPVETQTIPDASEVVISFARKDQEHRQSGRLLDIHRLQGGGSRITGEARHCSIVQFHRSLTGRPVCASVACDASTHTTSGALSTLRCELETMPGEIIHMPPFCGRKRPVHHGSLYNKRPFDSFDIWARKE